MMYCSGIHIPITCSQTKYCIQFYQIFITTNAQVSIQHKISHRATMANLRDHNYLSRTRSRNVFVQLMLLFSAVHAFVPDKIFFTAGLPFQSLSDASTSTAIHISTYSDSTYNYATRPQASKKKENQKGEFQWLNWVYKQYHATKPGQLSQEVLKQMTPAITRWGRRKTKDSGDRAEEILERIITDNLAGNPHAHLTVTMFNAAMDAYAKIGDPVGVQRILRRMVTLQKEHSHLSHLKPDVVSMSTLATGWAKSRSPDAASKAEAILKYMDVRNLTPNTITYNSVLHAMAVSNQIDKAIRVEDLVEKMKKRFAAGEDCEPDVYSYQSLIQAWSRTCLPGSPQKAEQVLLYLDEQSAIGNKNLIPNVYCFTSTIHAWSRSSERNRARNAYQLLNLMRKRYLENHAKNVKPNVVAFTAVLNACALPADVSEREDAFAIAQLVMSELSMGDMDAPNFLSFAAYLSAVTTTLDPGEQRDRIVKHTFERCKEAGQVAQIVLEKLRAAASPDLFEELVGVYLGDDGGWDLPSNWTKCIAGERVDTNQRAATVTEPMRLTRSTKLRMKAAQQFGGRLGPISGNVGLDADSAGISWTQKSL